MEPLFNHIEVYFGDDREPYQRTVTDGEVLTVNYGTGNPGAPTARILVGRPATGPGVEPPVSGEIYLNLGVASVFLDQLTESSVRLSGFTARRIDLHNSLPERAHGDAVRVIVALSRR